MWCGPGQGYIYRRTAPSPPPCRGVIPVQHTNVCWFFPVLFLKTDSVLNTHICNSAVILDQFRTFLSILGIWGVPPCTPGPPKGRLTGFLIDFCRFWGHLWEALGGLWRSLSALQSTKYGKKRSEMASTGQPCRKSHLSWRSGQHRVVPELDFLLNMCEYACFSEVPIWQF